MSQILDIIMSNSSSSTVTGPPAKAAAVTNDRNIQASSAFGANRPHALSFSTIRCDSASVPAAPAERSFLSKIYRSFQYRGVGQESNAGTGMHHKPEGGACVTDNDDGSREGAIAAAPQAQVDYEALPKESPVMAQLFAGAFAGILEHSVMYPIDAIKTRMQIAQMEANEGIIQAFSHISATEGLYGLWRGISTVIIGAGPAHAVYYYIFESTKTALCRHLESVNHHVKMKNALITDEKHPLVASVSGIAATTASDAIMTPFDVVKQRMQILQTCGMCDKPSPFHVAAEMLRKERLRPFYISYPTTLAMNIPFAAINFGVYEYASSKINPDQIYNPMLHCVSGAISGAAAAAVTTPLDCIKTALQTETFPHATGFFSAARMLYHKEGLRTFLRGMKPRIIFNFPSTAISWTAYEMAKAYLLPNSLKDN